jgi:hypothetical protein
MRSVFCRQHLKPLIGRSLNQASLRLPPSHDPPLPIGSDPNLADVHLGSGSVGRLLDELAVHRESFSRVWSGSAAALEYIVDALLTIGDENQPHALEFHSLINPGPRTDYRSNKALVESSSASAPSTPANLFPWRRPWFRRR